jgi:hypothetical protein
LRPYGIIDIDGNSKISIVYKASLRLPVVEGSDISFDDIDTYPEISVLPVEPFVNMSAILW